MHRLNLLCLLIVLTAFVGCSDVNGSDTLPPTAGEPERLEATVGPEGGRLEGQPLTPFEGVIIDVPPGALSKITPITVEVVYNDAPLPERAFAVGPQFRLDAQGAQIERPVRVTLPYYTEAVGVYDLDAFGVKVWRTGPEGWTLARSIYRTELAVTIEVDTLTTVGAGIKLGVPTWDAVPCLSDTSCAMASVKFCDGSGETPCLSPLPVLEHNVIAPRLLLDGQDLVMVTLSQIAQDTQAMIYGVRFNLETGRSSLSKPLPLSNPWDAGRFHGMALDTNGNLWVGTRLGVAKLSWTESSAHTLANAVPEANWLTSSGDALIWLRQHEGALIARRLSDQGTWDAPVTLLEGDPKAARGLAAHLLATPERDPNSSKLDIWLASTLNAGVIQRMSISSEQEVVETISIPDGERVLDMTTLDQESGLVVLRQNDLSVLVLDQDGLQKKPALRGVGAMIGDGAAGLWGASPKVPALIHAPVEGDAQLIPLSTSALDTPDAQGSIARAIIKHDDRTLVILTRDGRLMMLHL